MKFETTIYELELNRVIGLGEKQDTYQPPTELRLAPAGEFAGRDGRKYVNDKPKAVVRACNQLKLAIDIDHKISMGGAAALGWIGKVEERDGELWATGIEWLSEANWLLESKQYKYYSPVFKVEPNTRQIVNLGPLALTNNPNLIVDALNSEQCETTNYTKEESIMDKTQEELNSALKENWELNKQKLGLETELNAQKQKSQQLEAELNALKQQQAEAEGKAFEDELNSYLDAEVKACKLAIPERDFYAKTIKSKEELNSLRELRKDAIEIVPTQPSDKSRKLSQDELNALGFDADAIATAQNFGLTPEDFKNN